jgi:hypothetical protein
MCLIFSIQVFLKHFLPRKYLWNDAGDACFLLLYVCIANIFSDLTNIPPPVQNFQRYNERMFIASKEVCNDSMNAAGSETEVLLKYCMSLKKFF